LHCDVKASVPWYQQAHRMCKHTDVHVQASRNAATSVPASCCCKLLSQAHLQLLMQLLLQVHLLQQRSFQVAPRVALHVHAIFSSSCSTCCILLQLLRCRRSAYWHV
jgi:hypothetical protein